MTFIEFKNGFPFMINDSFIILYRRLYLCRIRILKKRASLRTAVIKMIGYRREDSNKAKECLVNIRMLRRQIEFRQPYLASYDIYKFQFQDTNKLILATESI